MNRELIIANLTIMGLLVLVQVVINKGAIDNRLQRIVVLVDSGIDLRI
jgi:hypothetical protein